MNAKKPFKKNYLTIAVLAGSALLAGLPLQQAQAAPSQTAQSVMVATTYDNTAYQIEPTVTYKFDRGTHSEPGTAMGYYTNTLTSGPIFVICTGGGSGGVNCASNNAPSAAAIAAATPAPNETKLQQLAQAARCTFFSGGTLTGDTYSSDVTLSGLNSKGTWKYTWGYTIAPDVANDVNTGTDGVQVAALTAWTSTQSGSLSVDVGFTGFVSSESYLNQSSKTKYSFTMSDNGVTRARNVIASLESSPDNANWTPLATMNLNNLDTDGDLTFDALAVSSTVADYSYYGNGGVFGNSAVYSSLHAGLVSPMGVNGILTSDTFANNNNDLASGNVHQANYGGTWLNVPGDPNGGSLSYRTVISGTLKGNSASGQQEFVVGSAPVIVNGCSAN